ncbi:MAG: peptidylprolyl isomerase [Pseudomonadota bacterium]
MTTAKSGDTVSFHYTGTLSDGSVFDSSEGAEPLGCVLGAGQIINGLDAALIGMGEGEEKTVTIAAEDAYGAHDPDHMQTVPRTQLPEEIPIEIGTQLQARTAEGHVVPLVITAFTDTDVTLDANHALAGKELTFAVRMVEVTPG